MEGWRFSWNQVRSAGHREPAWGWGQPSQPWQSNLRLGAHLAHRANLGPLQPQKAYRGARQACLTGGLALSLGIHMGHCWCQGELAGEAEQLLLKETGKREKREA
ncbi:hypothetical protein DsansV1_C29g0209661 [Dioscorea sansibarensis]